MREEVDLSQGHAVRYRTTMPDTVFRTCTLCEASCGLRFDVDGDRIVAVRPDDDDVRSHGHICPKGVAMAAVHHDPDRVRTPLRRDADGRFTPIGWDEAMELVASRLLAVQAAHGKDAVGIYVGNPVVHDHGALLMRAGLQKTLGTRNSFSAGSQDTSPRFAASFYLYGGSLVVPVPDFDHAHYLLCVGANPVVSNGSFLVAPDMKQRLRDIRARGGRVVVVDPRRTETAAEADEHVAVRPGADAALLLAMIQVLDADGRVSDEVRRIASGWDAIRARLAAFAPERVAAATGVAAEVIRRLAHELVDAPSGAVYSRIGVCNNRHGTIASWATDVLNLAAGRLGQRGGACFARPPIDVPRVARLLGDGHARWKSRVRGLPETFGDLPAATMAEEMETPGAGQIRALITFAGNPVLSVPNGRRLDAALGRLDFMVAIDLYVNETTRHADVILPSAWSLTHDHVELLPPAFAVRNVARWSPPVVARAPGERLDWEILHDLAERLGGGPMGDRVLDRVLPYLRRVGVRWTPTGMADLLLRLGPYGDRFLPWSRGLNLRRLRAAPHGIDLGPLDTGVAWRVLHRDRRVHLDAAPILAALDGLAAELGVTAASDALLLIGRRELRSNNSWMHNVPALVSGRERCELLVHPDDAARAGVADGDTVLLESRVHRGPVRVRVTDVMMPGVVSLPHGWGHAASAAWQRVAAERPGVSANDWTDDADVEAVVGQSILNGVPVHLRPLAAASAA